MEGFEECLRRVDGIEADVLYASISIESRGMGRLLNYRGEWLNISFRQV